ncbi:hypothetical protein [Streptosporangium sp. NPDC006007]|uniref:hypothetical protein n=1 Tax=Streptosporangium sp. NPDC006007 TaxID=3154575 RepID=UPI0033A0CC9D
MSEVFLMPVSVTGGIGFVGAHSAAASVRAAHRVRLLVREPSGVGRAPAPSGVAPRPVAETLGDTVRRLYGNGHLSAGRAGTAGADPSPVTAR